MSFVHLSHKKWTENVEEIHEGSLKKNVSFKSDIKVEAYRTQRKLCYFVAYMLHVAITLQKHQRKWKEIKQERKQ